MDAAPILIDHYDWGGGREAMLRFGPEAGPVVVLLLPLFEEANRTRTFGVTLLRELAARGVGGVLPDLPSTGESLAPTAAARLLHMREAMEALVAELDRQGRPCVAAGIRSGALLDSFGLFLARWHFAPMQGDYLLRELVRIGQAAAPGERIDQVSLIGADGPVEIAGNLVSPGMAADLCGALLFEEPGIPRRVVRLASDPRSADARFAGEPLWRRAEPGNDPALAAALAADLAAWVRTCGA